MIIPRDTKEADPELESMSAPDESDGDDDDSDIDPYGNDDDETKTDPDFDNDNVKTDHLGKDIDIGKLLKGGLHDHHHDHFEDKRLPFDRSDEGIYEFLKMLRKRKIRILKKSTQNGRYVMIVDRRQNKPKTKEFDMMIPKMYNQQAEAYEKEQKQQSVNKDKDKDSKSKPKIKGKTKTKIDWRNFNPDYNLNEEERKKYEAMDDLYFFQPCKPFGDLIDYNTMIEILHLNTLQCLVPKPRDNDMDLNANDDNKKKDNEEETKFEVQDNNIQHNKEEYIGAGDSCKGNMFVVSFHILSVDEIRCYLYVDGKYMRIKISNDTDDGDDLERMLGKYIRSDSDDDVDLNNNNSREKYKDFAFNTLDVQFDQDYKWTQEQQAKSNRF